ncbi:VOC family protein [Candidatus Woesearchaeota archaeon]|nr:VOC family protein [Candidatus Woesearchaeota archaeon]
MRKVVHFEIPADDTNRAQKFYKEIFGWDITAAPGMPYWMITTTPVDKKFMPTEVGGINGGMYKRDKDSSKTPVLVIDVPSVDEYVKKVESKGGKIFRKKVAVGDMGFYAQIKDTEENIIGLWETVKR